MTDFPADLPPPPERPVLPAGDAKTILVDRVREALIALPGYFQSTTNIEGVAATDLFALNSLLGASIEQQVVDTLNRIRPVWDPDETWATCRFERHPQTFPDVRLVRWDGAVTTVELGIELKGWYLLSKEGEPSLRFQNTREACAPHDLICVVPWHLRNVLSGSPVAVEPWVEYAQYAADYRNYHWQHVRVTTNDRTVTSPAAGTVTPYQPAGAAILDRAVADGGGNFGRLARVTGLMDAFTTRVKQTQLLGIEARHWIRFLKLHTEGHDPNQIEAQLVQELQVATAAGSIESAKRVVELVRQLVSELADVELPEE